MQTTQTNVEADKVLEKLEETSLQSVAKKFVTASDTFEENSLFFTHEKPYKIALINKSNNFVLAK